MVSLKEIWRLIPGFEDQYYVSNKGRVKSISRKIRAKNGKFRVSKEKILTQSINEKGYSRVYFVKNGKTIAKRVNRLVAKAFIPNPCNYSDVHHIDRNRQNNDVNNLKWMNHYENLEERKWS